MSSVLWCRVEMEVKLEDTSSSLKDEKQLRRRLEAQVKVMEDETTELKVEKESLEKVPL